MLRPASIALASLALVAVACGGSGPLDTAEAPGPASKGQLSAAQCEAAGGKVVGDIGDGAIHRPDYVCPESGKAPLGSIAAEAGAPVAVEGSVCCP
jgi:hypothetical protein